MSTGPRDTAISETILWSLALLIWKGRMDHKQAVDMQAAEKYVLGELPTTLRDEYEEHFFDCAECAVDVKVAAAFVDNTRDVLRQGPGKELTKAAVAGGWFAWFRPIVAVPAFAALLLIIVYQNTFTIPQAKKEAALNASQLVTSSYSLQMANVRGGEEVKVRIHPEESFALKFDFTPSRTFDSYICELQDASGRALLQESVPGSSTNKEQELVVRGGLVKPGKYNLVFAGVPGTRNEGSRKEVLRLGFSIEFLP